MLHLVDNLLWVRELSGLSQTAFGSLIGASKDMVHSYEKGRAKPSAEIIVLLAEIVGVTTEEFLKKDIRKSKSENSKAIKSVISDLLKATTGKNTGTDNDSVKDKYIASLERENNRLQKDLELSLGELRHNILLARAVSETTQDLLIEFLAKQNKQKKEDFAFEVGKANGEKYKTLKEEGSY